MRKCSFVTVISIIAISTFGVYAEPIKSKYDLRSMDKDRNGVLSFREFSSISQRMFSLLDQDSNGYISRLEFDNVEKMKKKRKLFKHADRLDKNDDDQIGKEEFISGKKFRAKQNSRSNKNKFFKVSPEEKRKLKEEIFNAVDKDKDGNLSLSELAETKKIGPKILKDIKFKELDKDNNKKITETEFLAPLKVRFKEIDKNSDELLDRKELMAISHNKKKGKKRKNPDGRNDWREKKPVMHKERTNN